MSYNQYSGYGGNPYGQEEQNTGGYGASNPYGSSEGYGQQNPYGSNQSYGETVSRIPFISRHGDMC